MKLDYIVLVAFLALAPSALLLFITRRKYPRVSRYASTAMTISFGVISLWFAITLISKGVSEAVPQSRIFKTTVRQADEPIAFGLRVALFGIPGLLLLGAPLVDVLQNLISQRRSRKAKQVYGKK